jgi:multicomponent Na+:H+ antiporter subunit D
MSAEPLHIQDHLPALQVVVPLLGAVVAAIVRNGRLAWLVALAVSWTMPVIAFALLREVASNTGSIRQMPSC